MGLIHYFHHKKSMNLLAKQQVFFVFVVQLVQVSAVVTAPHSCSCQAEKAQCDWLEENTTERRVGQQQSSEVKQQADHRVRKLDQKH